MAAPCYEDQAREKIKVPPAIAKAFMNEALEQIKGGRSYPEALQALHERSGLQHETINSILKRDPQVFSRTKQAIARSGKVRQIRDAADAFAEQLKTDGKMYQEPGYLAKAWDANRTLALAGHSVVYPWSHMRNWAVQIPTEAGRARMNAFWRAAGDVWKYRGEKGAALYEMDMGLMQMADHYDFAKQSSLDIVPGRRDPGDILIANKKPSWQTRNFDALKPARYTAFKAIWDGSDPVLREGDMGKAYGAVVARDLNYATGSIKMPVGEAAGSVPKGAAALSEFAGRSNALLSSKLFFGKHMDAWIGPLRYLAKKGRMTTAENAASNVALGRWANTVAAHLSILGVNYAFNKMMGWETPNLGDPTKSDYLRMKVGGFTVPFSPMLEALRLPIVFTASMIKGDPKEGGSRLWMALWNAAHPAAHTLYEQVAGKDYMGRPITWSVRNLLAREFPSITPKITQEQRNKPIGALEYAGTKTPIALAGGLHTFYQALRTQGVNASMAMAFVKAAAAAASSAIVGTHMYEQEPQKPQRPQRPAQPLPKHTGPWWQG